MSDRAAVELGDYLSSLSFNDLPDAVVDKAKLCLRDALGCLLAAQGLPLAGMLRPWLTSIGVSGVPGGFGRGSVAEVALINATLINALDFDDIYRKGHPGATVIGAALAMGNLLDCSGQALIEGIVAGYEVGCRIGLSLVQSQPRKLLHGHGTWQTLGAAAAVARLARLTPGQAAHALALAAVNAPLASVMKTVYGAAPSMAKNNFGAAAQAGVNAALLAGAGAEGPLDVFEGETGFWRMFGADGSDGDALIGELGTRYEIHQVGYKPYSGCRILQSSVEAAVAACSGRDPRSIQALRIQGPEILSRPPFSELQPADIWAAEFSVAHAVAMAVSGIPAGPDWFTRHALQDEGYRNLRTKISVAPWPDAPARHHHAARAEIIFQDGQIAEAAISVARGEAANPLSDAFLRSKFVRLAGRALSREQADRLVVWIDTLPNQPHISSLFAGS